MKSWTIHPQKREKKNRRNKESTSLGNLQVRIQQEIILTPNTNVENAELRNRTGPCCGSPAKRSDQKAKYTDKTVIKIACTVDIVLHTVTPHKRDHNVQALH